jgi:hypothetical protein
VISPFMISWSDVRQLRGTANADLRGCVFVYAASSISSGRLAATFQGSNSSMRLIG